MARIRTVKPEFWTNEKLSRLPEVSHMIAAALLNYADDDGYFNANVGLIKAAIFPLREPSRSIPVVLQDLSGVGYLRLGTGADGRCYGHIINFESHQAINKKRESKIKSLEIDWADSGRTPVVLPDDSRSTPTWNGTGNGTGNREQGTGKGVAASPRSPTRSARKAKTALAPDFTISDRVKTWATKKGYDRINQHLEVFLSQVRKHDYRYVDWNEAFMGAIRDDWGNVRKNGSHAMPTLKPRTEPKCIYIPPDTTDRCMQDAAVTIGKISVDGVEVRVGLCGEHHKPAVPGAEKFSLVVHPEVAGAIARFKRFCRDKNMAVTT